jgi:hypothetical protein
MSFLSCTKAVHRTLVATTLAALVALGSQAATEAAIVVSLEQVGGPAVAVPGQQTVVPMLLTATGTGSPLPLDVVGVSSLISWASSDANVTDLYNVTSAGGILNQASAASAVVSNTPGYLFANVVPFNSLTTAGTSNPTFERAYQTDGDGTPISLTDPLSQVTIATIYFGVTADVTGTFNFTLTGTGSYGFTDNGFNIVSFSDGGGTLQVVPEPSTMYSLFAVGLVTTGIQVRRLRRRKAA